MRSICRQVFALVVVLNTSLVLAAPKLSPPQACAYLQKCVDAGLPASGEFDLGANPILVRPGQALRSATPRGVTLRASGMPAVIVDWVPPTAELSLWRADGGLVLGKGGWRLAFPGGYYAHPGTAPGFWRTLEKWSMEVDVAIDWGWPTVPICGCPPIWIYAAEGQLVVQYALDGVDGFRAIKVPMAKGPARRRIRVTLDAGNLIVALDGAEKARATAIGKLADNLDSPFTLGATVHNVFDGPGDGPAVILYGFTMDGRALTLPARGDWKAVPDGMLVNANRVQDTWQRKPALHMEVNKRACVEGVNVLVGGDRGIGIAVGTSLGGAEVRRCYVQGGYSSVASLNAGVNYPFILEGVDSRFTTGPAFAFCKATIWARDLVIGYPGRNAILAHGGNLRAENVFVAPRGGRGTDSFLRLAIDDEYGTAQIFNLQVDAEEAGTEPAVAYLEAETGFRVLVADCWLGMGDTFAVLRDSGKPTNVGRLEVRNTTTWDVKAKVVSTPRWRLVGKPND